MPVAGIGDKGSAKSQLAFGRETARAILQQSGLNRTIERATVQTDQASAFEGPESSGRRHRTVNHGAAEQVRHEPYGNTVTTNGIESIRFFLKSMICGVRPHVSAKHLAAYLNELAFRVNGSNSWRQGIACKCRHRIENGFSGPGDWCRAGARRGR